jgi:hypothetical protein
MTTAGAEVVAVLKVFLTTDTEAWPRSPRWRETHLEEDIHRDIYGKTDQGTFGIGYQMDVLDAHGLKGIFLVESLFSCEVGLEPLHQIVQDIQRRGHEVQLHLHSEWLAWMTSSLLPGRTGQHIRHFSEDEQAVLLGKGLANLRECGAENVCAFRAGNYGANLDTLRALARCKVTIDTSHNSCYLRTACDMPTAEPLLQPRELFGVLEVPVSFFRDWPGHYRHAQLCACSAAELEGVLIQAWLSGWQAFTIVSHSFELTTRRKHPKLPPRPDRFVLRRFTRLCRFLAENRDKFHTAGFCDIDDPFIPQSGPTRSLSSSVWRTARRFVEQALRRVW